MKPDMGDEDEDADTGSTDTDKFEPATISSKGYLIYKKDGAIITRDLEDEQKMFRTERKEEVSSAEDPVRMMRYFATGGSEIFKEPLSIGVVRSKHLYLFVISFALQFTLYGKQPQVHTPLSCVITWNLSSEPTAISVGSFGKIASLAFDPAVEGSLYWLESDNGVLKKLDFETGKIKTITKEVYGAENLQFNNGYVFICFSKLRGFYLFFY